MQNELIKWRLFSFCIQHSALSILVLLSGCAALGVFAHALPPATVQAKYAGLAKQSVGVMVWTDRGVRIDWPNMQLDLANAVQKKLKAETKAKSIAGATYTVEPASIVRYQQDHPEIDALPITEVAPALGVTRLIYIEMSDFSTRSNMSVDLFLGQAKATVRVVEVNSGANGGPNGAVAKVAFEQANVAASYPPKASREGVPGIGDGKTYAGTIDAFAAEVSHLFIPFTPDDD